MPWQNNGGDDDRNPWGKPRGGGPGGPGGPQPPDIDEMIGKFQDWLKSIMPGGGGGFGPVLVGAFLVLTLLYLSSYRVAQDERGVVLRFGEWVRTEAPGFHFKLPYPIETVIKPKYEAQRQTYIGASTKESLMLTTDPAIIDIAYTVFWRIEDAGKFLFHLEGQEDTVRDVAESAMREVIGRTKLEVAQTEGRLQIERDTLALIQSTLDLYDSGISITEVKLEKVDPPRQVIDAFKDVQAAGQDKQTYQNEADRYANQIVPEARGDAERMAQEAEPYKEQVIAIATGDAARFLAVYNQYALAKDVTRKRIYLETMEEILTGMNKIILDDDAGSGVVPYLPLPEVQARRQQQSEGISVLL